MSDERNLPRWTLDASVLSVLALIVLGLCVSLSSRYVLDVDVVNLALSITRFDVLQFQPHPPGYLGYVLLLKATAALTGLPLLDVPRAVSCAFAMVALIVTWLAVRRLAPAQASAALWAAALVATNPITLYYGIDGQTHAAEASMGAALLWALADPAQTARPRRQFAVGALLAAGGSLRPSFALLSLLPVLWIFRRDRLALLRVGVVALIGTAAWLVPTVWLSGGLRTFQQANGALFGSLARKFSLLSADHDAAYVALNLRDLAAWSVLALAGAALAVLAVRASRATATNSAQLALTLAALMAAPALAFYALVFCAEAGYLAGLVPPAAMVMALYCDASARWLRVLPALWVVAQLAFFFAAPEAIARTDMLPNASELVEREFRIDWLFQQLVKQVPETQRVLLISDHPELTLPRQFPLLRPGTDVLFFHDSKNFALGNRDFISFATDTGWWAAPAGVLAGQAGERNTLRSAVHYDVFALDPRNSNDLRARLAAQTSCTIAPRSEQMQLQLLPARCFPAPRIRIDALTFEFAAH